MGFKDFLDDSFRYTGQKHLSWKLFFSDPAIWYLFAFRCKGFKLYKKLLSDRYGINLGKSSNIQPGLYLGHAFGINVNPNATIGKNCSLHKGCTIGQENRGNRKGSPHLGDKVWVGINATIVGNVEIGEDTLIAPNAYVNFDVPPHSIVIGNPAHTIPKNNATEDYITNCID